VPSARSVAPTATGGSRDPSAPADAGKRGRPRPGRGGRIARLLNASRQRGLRPLGNPVANTWSTASPLADLPLCGGAATHVSAPRRATPGRPLRQWRADALALLPSRLRIPRFRPAGASGRWTRWAALGGVLAGTGTSRVACARSARAGRERPQRGDGPVAAPEATTLDGCGSNRSSTRTASAPSQSAQSTRACSTASRPPCRRVRGAQPT
jgi:hypothetical protein